MMHVIDHVQAKAWSFSTSQHHMKMHLPFLKAKGLRQYSSEYFISLEYIQKLYLEKLAIDEVTLYI